LDLPPTPVESIDQARKIGKKAGLKYVYSGNVWGDEGENTYCPGCKRLLVKREGFFVEENNIVDSKCRFCGYKIYGRF
jgi:pyruvate formate lyase activating enzyme